MAVLVGSVGPLAVVEVEVGHWFCLSRAVRKTAVQLIAHMDLVAAYLVVYCCKCQPYSELMGSVATQTQKRGGELQ